MRAYYVSRDYDIPETEASRRILKTESERKAFIRQYFHADICDPFNYDLVMNRAKLSIEDTATAVMNLAMNNN